MNAQKQKTINNDKNMKDKNNNSKTKEQCPREKKDCEHCNILFCPEEKV
jgi:hypothetical protein